jgi:hypothetical protein
MISLPQTDICEGAANKPKSAVTQAVVSCCICKSEQVAVYGLVCSQLFTLYRSKTAQLDRAFKDPLITFGPEYGRCMSICLCKKIPVQPQ